MVLILKLISRTINSKMFTLTNYSFIYLFFLLLKFSFPLQITEEQSSKPIPIDPCTESNEGEMWTSSSKPPISTIWICQKNEWIPHFVLPYNGKTKQVAGKSCKDIKRTLTEHRECSAPLRTGAYWINITNAISGKQQSMKVYCEMSLNGGGWTLVWKHSYMQVGRHLREYMKYYSTHYNPCTDIERGWCNIPNKARLRPTEMMIVAYSNKKARYAYKGWFNYNIDYNWRGGVLIEPKRILDKCTNGNWTRGIPPAPSANNYYRGLLGIAFDKHSPGNIDANCDTIAGPFTKHWDCRWVDCDGWGSAHHRMQMTMAIYVR